jgi:two-component system nitrogen regulation response regulator GlnG
VIAATHVDLEAAVEAGRFRQDLYYRLNVVVLPVPPLRDRLEDLPLIAAHFLRMHGGAAPPTLSPETLEEMIAYGWPGNVRELVNLCRRLSVLAPGTEVRVEDLPQELGETAASGPTEADWAKALALWADRQAMSGKRPLLDEAQPEFERVLIRAALKRTQGHRQEAAKLLGWGRNTLTRKLKELGMEGID